MSILDSLIELFGNEEAAAEMIESVDIVEEAYIFYDFGDDQSLEIITKVSESYSLELPDAENFLEVTQSIQHSLSKFGDQVYLSQVDDYIDNFNESPSSLIGLVNNVKGIYGEHEVFEKFRDALDDNVKIVRSMATNAKDVDFIIYNEDGEILDKIQVKISENPNYILKARESLSDDITIVTTNEAIENIIELKGELPVGIIGVDITNAEITEQVERTINILKNTEPEFDVLLHDPVLSEYMQQGIAENPFVDGTLGRKMYSDYLDRPAYNWTFSGFEDIPFEYKADYILHVPEWDPSNFAGAGNPFEEAMFFQPQIAGNSCAVVTQRNILESLTGESLTEEELCRHALERGIYHPSYGTPSSQISALLEEKGLICINKIDGSFDEINKALTEGKKVMVGLDASEISNPLRDLNTGEVIEQPNMGHCVQVTGIDYNCPTGIKVILADPGFTDGAVKAVELADFMNAWEDFHFRLTIVSKP
jgi:hypothetical protein